MARRESEIQDLKARLQAGRLQLEEGIQHLEDQFNVRRRVRLEVAEHPLTWVAVSVIAGFVVVKAVPTLFRSTGKPSLVQGLLPMALRAAAMFALPLLRQAWVPTPPVEG